MISYYMLTSFTHLLLGFQYWVLSRRLMEVRNRKKDKNLRTKAYTAFGL